MPEPRSASGGIALRANVWARPSRVGDTVFVLFLVSQCLDGLLTYLGVLTFGPGIEANPLVAALMLHFGYGTGLLGAKVVAIILGIALHMRQVHSALAALTAFYFAAAILPWSTILFV